MADADEKSPFKAFVGIDFGTDGSGLAYALPDGSAFIHNMWDDTDATRKPKTSVLFDKDDTVIKVGTRAQSMYLELDEDKGWKLFERFKMNLYEEPSDKASLKNAESKIDYADLKEEIETTHKHRKAASKAVFVAQLQYLKKHAFKFIQTHLTKKVKSLKGNSKTGWPEIQFFLTVPAIWSDKAKNQMVKWAIESGLITGKIPNQLQIVYEPDCAALSIYHAILKSMDNNNDNDDNTDKDTKNKKKKKKKKQKKLRALIPKVSINVPFQKGDKYVLLDVGGGTCDVACHEVISNSGKFAVAEILHPSGGKWGATYIDERFMELLTEIFSKDLMNIYQMHGDDGRQSYLTFLQHFLNEAKLSYYENYGKKDIPLYHDIELPANFVNFVVTQYAVKYKGESTADDEGFIKGFNELNEIIQDRSEKYKRNINPNKKKKSKVAKGPSNPTDDFDYEGVNEENNENDEEEDVNAKFGKRNWMIKIIEADDDDDYEEDYLLSVHNDVWTYLFDVIVKPIIKHCKGILIKNEMKDAKYIFLVGGFANSKYFQMKMKDAFKNYQNLQVVTPGLPGLCVVDGAARYGLDTTFVKVRRMRKTYGIECDTKKNSLDLKKFPKGYVEKNTYHDAEKKCDYVENIFSVFVKQGQEVTLYDKPIRKKYYKIHKSQTSAAINVYSSTIIDPLTTTESTSSKLATVSVPLSKTDDNVMVEFSFSKTLITVYTYPVGKENQKKKLKIDYYAEAVSEGIFGSVWNYFFG